jgi:hypothetical protein
MCKSRETIPLMLNIRCRRSQSCLALQLRLRANLVRLSLYQFVFDILACFAVGVGAGAALKFFPEPNPCKNHAAAQCWDSDPDFWPDPDSTTF